MTPSLVLLATHEMQDDGRNDRNTHYHADDDTRRVLDTNSLKHRREPAVY